MGNKGRRMKYCVVQLNDYGLPNLVVPFETFEMAQNLAAKIAQDNNVPPGFIMSNIHNVSPDSGICGTFFTNPYAGVYVMKTGVYNHKGD